MKLLMPTQAGTDVTEESPPAARTDARRELLRSLLERAEPAQDPARQQSGTTVLARIEDCFGHDAWLASLPSGSLVRARVAVSCVVRPMRGDLVQLCTHPDGGWILAILERTAATPDVALDFGNANLVLKARDVQFEATDRLRLNAAHIESRANAITSAAAERYALISGTDATHAGNALLHAERHMGLHARSATITAESLLKIDAAQIHMG